MLEYEREFSCIVSYIAFIVQDEKNKPRCFVHGLQPEIYKMVQPIDLQTFWEVVDRALLFERGEPIVQLEQKACEMGKEKKQSIGGFSGQESSKWPSKHICS